MDTAKIEETQEFLIGAIKHYKNAVLLCSFGKDSMVMLHLLLTRNIKIPIVYYRDPWFPRKNAWADQVIGTWNLEVHDYPPLRVSLCTGTEMIGLVSEYQCGPNSTIKVLKNTAEFQEGDIPDDFLCGVNFLIRPCGRFNFPWSVGFVAHKDCDEDTIFGPVPLQSRIVYRDDGPDFAFPLREWTHDDVWDYTEKFNVPVQIDRYDVENRREWPDKSLNSDWYPVCLRCVDKRKDGQEVFCPKWQKTIRNVAKEVPEFGWEPDYFSYSTEKIYKP